jgi:transitional endoplasmic reticulum ATPase
MLQLLAPGAAPRPPDPGEPADRARKEADRLIARRKREILERECFGLVEFVEPQHGFEVVGGMDEVKKDLLVIAESIREGRTSRVPMGILFTGPMGTGKTFVAEAFAKECGLTTIKLKNFRSKWVGATEGNLEKILNVIKAIGQVVVIIDEGDRAFGNTDGEGDGGTSSRVIARIKEFMSDTSNRGRILFLVMTNRPDKLDVDLKRAGRLDRKIPFLYVQTPEEVEQIVAAQVCARTRSPRPWTSPTIRDGSRRARRLQQRRHRGRDPAGQRRCGARGRQRAGHAEQFIRAATDYFPSRDEELLEYMELLAVFEASSRRLLPPKYASTTPEELDARLRQLRAIVGTTRAHARRRAISSAVCVSLRRRSARQ